VNGTVIRKIRLVGEPTNGVGEAHTTMIVRQCAL
jgi:hypothetical protein